ncbi:hypothetical protein JXQ31_03890 [candidate division KSB1 bacterium]|nr:hypothetical protein [candidate division KSB1 bacterium]
MVHPFINRQNLLHEFFFKIFNIHEGEEKRAFLMWLYIFLIISGLMIVKPMVNALFLSEFGPERLPYVFILVAIFASVVSVLYGNSVKSINLHHLIEWTLFTAIGLFLVFWLFLTFNWLERWVLYVLYITVAIYAVITSSQFWIMANIIFNSREAKRLFGFIGSGAIAGGIFGGYLTNLLAPLLGSKNLIFVFLFLLSGCILIIKQLWQGKPEQHYEVKTIRGNGNSRKNPNSLRLILSSRHLKLMASVLGIAVLVGKLVEYQFSAISTEYITHEDELTAFFGFWLSNLNVATLLIQIFITPRVVGIFGVGTSLFFLPVALLIGASTILIFPELWAVVLIKLLDGSLKNSINKSGMELMALPIATDIKSQAKSFIDVFVDSFATGISGILLIILTDILNASTKQVSFLSIIIICGWLYLIFLIKTEYLHSFRLKLELSGSAKNKLKTPDLTNQSVINGILKVLQEGDKKTILHTLYMIRPLKIKLFVPAIQNLVVHSSPLIRLEALQQLQNYKYEVSFEKIKALIHDENLDIRAEAMYLLYDSERENREEKITEHLNSRDYIVRSAALLCTARLCANNSTYCQLFNLSLRIQKELLGIQKSKDSLEIITMKRCCARVIGEGKIVELYPFLHYLLRDSENQVVASAIIGAGLTREKEFWPVLIHLLREKKYWTFTQTALVNFGPNIITLLSGHLKDNSIDRDARLRIPKVMEQIEIQSTVDALTQNLDISDRAIRSQIIDALYQLRLNAPHLRFGDPDIMHFIFEESNDFMNTLVFLYHQNQLNNKITASAQTNALNEKLKDARTRLISILEKRLDRKLKRIFHMLGLKYPPDDIENVYAGIKSNDNELRLNAIDFLDNLLEPDLKKVILPIAESALLDEVVTKSLQRFVDKYQDEKEYFDSLMNSEDSDLKLYSLELIELLNDTKYLPIIAKCTYDHDFKVREKAQFMLKKFGL